MSDAGGAVTGRHLVISHLSSPLSDIRNAIFIAKINNNFFVRVCESETAVAILFCTSDHDF